MAEAKYYEYTTNTNAGKIGLSLQVFGLITKIAIEENEDVTLDTPVKTIRNVGKSPIICELNHSNLNIQVDVKVKYGKNVNKTVKELQEHIAQAIKNMTDVDVASINIRVVGIDF